MLMITNCHTTFMLIKRLALLSFVMNTVDALAFKAEWISLTSTSSKVTPKRSGHTSFVSTKDGTPHVFGGYIEIVDDDEDFAGDPDLAITTREVTNDLWKYENGGWNRVATLGDIPGPRLVSASGVIGEKGYLLGGWDPQTPGTGGVILDDVHCLDLETNVWSKLPLTFPDGPTSRHVAVSMENSIVIHNHRCHKFVYTFDGTSFTKQTTSGNGPPPGLGLHAACRCGTDTVVVFGGATSDGTMSNTCYTLNTKTWEWATVPSSVQSPSPRAGSCLVSLTEDSVLLFGGAQQGEPQQGLVPKNDVWILDINYGVWEKLNVKEASLGGGGIPPPRNAATLTPLLSSSLSSSSSPRKTANKRSQQFLLTGGWEPFLQTWDDVFVLNVME